MADHTHPAQGIVQLAGPGKTKGLSNSIRQRGTDVTWQGQLIAHRPKNKAEGTRGIQMEPHWRTLEFEGMRHGARLRIAD